MLTTNTEYHGSYLSLLSIRNFFYKTKLFSNTNETHMNHCYVDDTFVALKREKSVIIFSFFSTLFTPVYGSILRENVMVLFLFWMFLVEKNEAEFITSVYRKPTFTGQYLRWNSFCPSKTKIDLVKTLIRRALMICFNSKLQSELDNNRSVMLKNGCPNHVVNSAITRKLQNFKRPVTFGASKCSIYLHLSWIIYTVSMGFEKQILS